LAADHEAKFGKYQGSGKRRRLGISFDANSSVSDVLLSALDYRVNKGEHNFCSIAYNRLKWDPGEWDSLGKITKPFPRITPIKNRSGIWDYFASQYGSRAFENLIQSRARSTYFVEESHQLDAAMYATIVNKSKLLRKTIEDEIFLTPQGKDKQYEYGNGMEGLLSREGLPKFIRNLDGGSPASLRGRAAEGGGCILRSEEPAYQTTPNTTGVHVSRYHKKEDRPSSWLKSLTHDPAAALRELAVPREGSWPWRYLNQ